VPDTELPASTPASAREPDADAPTVTAPGTAELPTWSAGANGPAPTAPPPPNLPGYRDLTHLGVGGIRADVAHVAELVKLGVRFVIAGSDVQYLMRSARDETAALRKAAS